MKKIILKIIFVLLITFFSLLNNNGICSTTNKDLLKKGIDLFNLRQFDQAYNVLTKAFEKKPESMSINFYLGRAAFETGNYEMSVMVFERALILDPYNQRVKLEIARAYQKLGVNNMARRYCHEVLSTNPPAQVKDNIEKFLALIDKSEQHHFYSGSISIGIDSNDNIWATPPIETIQTILGDIPLSGASSTKEHDLIYNTTATLNHQYTFFHSNYSWNTSSVFYKNIYDTIKELNILYLDINTGPRLTFNKKTALLQLTANYLELDKKKYERAIGAKTTIAYLANSNMIMGSTLAYEIKKFDTNPQKDAKNYSFSFDSSLLLKNHWIELSLAIEKEDAKDNEYSYDRYTGRFSINKQLPFRLTAFASYEFQNSRYKANADLFDKRRNDYIHYAGCGLKKILWESLDKKNNIELKLNYMHTKALSNIKLYKYQKNLFQISCIYNF